MRQKHDLSFERGLGGKACSNRGEATEDAGKDRHGFENVGSIPMVSQYGAKNLKTVPDEDAE